MSAVQLFAVTAAGPQPLPVPDGATTVHVPFEGLPAGVYSALCTFEHNKFLCLEDHLERLDNSMALLGWSYRLDRPALRRALHEVCTAFPWPDARIRIEVLPEAAVSLGSDSQLFIALAPMDPVPPELYEQGVSVGLADRLHREKPLVKESEFVQQRRPYLESRQAYEYLLLDEQERLLEGATSNFYAVRSGVIWTADEGVLEGIARKVILQLVAKLAIPLELTPISLAEVETLDEAFLSSSSRAVIPIISITGRTIGDGRPGPITRRLLAAYRAFMDREIRVAVEGGE